MEAGGTKGYELTYPCNKLDASEIIIRIKTIKPTIRLMLDNI